MKLKLSKLNSTGAAHLIILLVALVGFALVGTYMLVASHAATVCTGSTYSSGSKGSCVTYIQQIVNASGASSSITADGDFGPKTKSAVIAFQKFHSLSQDGIVGKNTWAALCAVPASAATTPKKNAGCSGSSTGSTTATTKPGSCTISASSTAQVGKPVTVTQTVTAPLGHGSDWSETLNVIYSSGAFDPNAYVFSTNNVNQPAPGKTQTKSFTVIMTKSGTFRIHNEHVYGSSSTSLYTFICYSNNITVSPAPQGGANKPV